MNFPNTGQTDHELWLMLDGDRVLARLRAAGPSWMHVFIDGDVPKSPKVHFTFVLRGAEGGVIDGSSDIMSSVERSGRRVLHLRIEALNTRASPSLLERFARDVLNDSGPSPLVRHRVDAPVWGEAKLIGARYEDYRSMPLHSDSYALEDSVVVSKAIRWRLGSDARPAHLVRSSLSGRRFLVRLKGPVPSAWESVKVELDVGCMGEPRPIQLHAMVLGTLDTDDEEAHHVVVRLLRWSKDSDRLVWLRWLAHQQRLDTTVPSSEALEDTRSIRVIRPSHPKT